MFKVNFVKTAWDGDCAESASSMAMFQRDDTLPFVPHPGIEYFWGLTAPEVPRTVRWDFDDRQFTCVMPDAYPGDGIDDFDFDGLIKHLVDGGWRLVSRELINR